MSKLARADVITPLAYAKKNVPQTIQSAANPRSQSLSGRMSPYPVVVTVVTSTKLVKEKRDKQRGNLRTSPICGMNVHRSCASVVSVDALYSDPRPLLTYTVVGTANIEPYAGHGMNECGEKANELGDLQLVGCVKFFVLNKKPFDHAKGSQPAIHT